MKKIDCVSDITMENITLDDLGMAFAEVRNLCYPYGIRPVLTLRFGFIPYYYNRADRAELQEFS